MSAPTGPTPAPAVTRARDLTPDLRAELRLRLWRRGLSGAATGWAEDGGEPASASQRAMVYLDRLAPGNPAYTTPVHCRVSGALDVGALRHALDTVMRRHEVLRTALPLRDGRPAPTPGPVAPLPLRVVDLRDVDPAGRRARLDRLVAEDRQRPFDLTVAPLARACLVRLEDHESVLLLAFHHAVVDGWSVAVLTGELGELYSAAVTGRGAELPPPVPQHGEFARWQRDWLLGTAAHRGLEYWVGQLADPPGPLALPVDHPRPPGHRLRGAVHGARLPDALWRRLDGLGRRHGATPFMVLLAVFQLLLARLTGADDIMVGSQVANRRRAETHGLVGFLANVVVLRGRPGAARSFTELLAAARHTCLEAFERQEVPLVDVVRALGPPRPPGRNPLYQVGLTLHNTPEPVRTSAGLMFTPLEESSVDGGARLDLELDARADADGLRCSFTYAADLFDARTVAGWAAEFVTLAETVAADPDGPLPPLPVPPVRTEAAGPPVPPAPGHLVVAVAAAVAAVLGVPSVDPDADFFHLGGHSMLALELIARCRPLGRIAVGDWLDGPATARRAAGLLSPQD